MELAKSNSEAAKTSIWREVAENLNPERSRGLGLGLGFVVLADEPELKPEGVPHRHKALNPKPVDPNLQHQSPLQSPATPMH